LGSPPPSFGCAGRARPGERTARLQGQPRRSKLDPHRDFLLGLIEAKDDISLVEMQERLAAERGIRASVGTIWTVLDRCNMTVKKDGSCGRAGPA
jgi:transposase